VVDRHGNGVPGVTVNFVVTAGGGTVSPAEATTNSAGRAAAEWTLGTGAIAQEVEARVPGLDGSPVVFTATGTLVEPSEVAIGDTVYGVISRAGEVDEFTFEAQAGQEIILFFQPLSGSGHLYLSLYEYYGTPSEKLLDDVY